MKASEHYKNVTGQQISQNLASLNDIAEALEDFLDNRADNYDTADLATLFYFLKDHHKALDEAVKRFYHVKNRLERGILPAKMETEGVDMVRVPEVARSFGVQNKMSATILDKDAAFEWLHEIGQEALIQETVNAGTLSALCRRMMLDEGIEPPENAVKISTYKVIGVNKYTPKG